MYKANEYDLRDTRDSQVDITLCSLRVPGLMEKIVCGDKNVATPALARTNAHCLPGEIDLDLH